MITNDCWRILNLVGRSEIGNKDFYKYYPALEISLVLTPILCYGFWELLMVCC